jgi:hypothetical protein
MWGASRWTVGGRVVTVAGRECLRFEDQKRNTVYVVSTVTLMMPISADPDRRWPLETMAAAWHRRRVTQDESDRR